MGIFNFRNKKVTNAVNINDVGNVQFPVCKCGWDEIFNIKKGYRPFAQMYLYAAMEQLYSGLSNVTFHSTSNSKGFTVEDIASFIDRNATLLLNQYLFKGYIAVAYGKDRNYWIPKTNDLKFGANGAITNKNVVAYYSPIYQTKRQAKMDLLRPQLDLIDTLCNNLVESSGTMGVLPVISGDAIPANPEFKDNLAKAMSKEYGWSDDQLKYFLAKSNINVQTIDLKVKDLEFRENITNAFKIILNYLEVPVDLVLGQSTYNNLEGARHYLYDSTIRKYAEILLKVGQALVTATGELIPKKTLTYHIYNVPGLDKTLSDMCSEKQAYVDLLKSLGESGVDVSEELARVYSDIKELYLKV